METDQYELISLKYSLYSILAKFSSKDVNKIWVVLVFTVHLRCWERKILRPSFFELGNIIEGEWIIVETLTRYLTLLKIDWDATDTFPICRGLENGGRIWAC